MKGMKESVTGDQEAEVGEEVDTTAGEWGQGSRTEDDTATKVSPTDGL